MKKFESFLKQKNCLTNKIDSNVIKIKDTLDSKLTDKQKIQIICHYMIHFASQFRKAIYFEKGFIPINSIAFLFNYSGSGKDTTIRTIKSIFSDGLKRVEEKRNNINNIQAAERYNADVEMGVKGIKIKDYLYKLPPLEFGLSTPEGMISSLETNQMINVGSININSNEFIAEMNSNGNILSMMTAISEIYDSGFKHSKQLKDKSNQTNTLEGIFLSALFTSSFDINVDPSVRQKLLLEFRSRFARRSSITFNTKIDKEEQIDDVDTWIENTINKKNDQYIVQNAFRELFANLASKFLQTDEEYIDVSEDANKLILVYREYCSRKSKENNSIAKDFTSLNIANRWFQALKLSGGLAICNAHTIIEEEDIVKAINITEIINSDVQEFEQELNKGEYEILVDYCNQLDTDKHQISVHELVKNKLISKRSLENDLNNIVTLANSKDIDGLYTIMNNNDGIEYNRFKECSDYGISFIKVEAKNKDDYTKYMNKTFQYARVPFDRLANLLKNKFIYSPYKYINGERRTENLINKTNLIIFDIDESDISIEECHNNLSDINHIVSTTSDKDNIYKYRVILPFDREVEIETKIYKRLCQEIAIDYLTGIKYDNLSQVQAYYSYEDSRVYITTDAENLKIKDYITNIKMNNTFDVLTPQQKKKKLADSSEFDFAYAVPEGHRHRTMIKAIAKAFYLGADEKYVSNLIEDINNSYVNKFKDIDYEGIIKFKNKLFQIKE